MPKKKIYDIVPPKVANKLEDTLKELSFTKPVKRGRRPAKPTRKTKPMSATPKRWLWISGGVLVIIVAIYLFFALPKATIAISPALEDFNVQEKITADKTVTDVDATKKLIPAQYISVEKTETQEFPATGIATSNQKATGTITVYNKYSPAAPITLKTGTHFLSDSGKYFVTSTQITIPAMKGKVAGSISVKVTAEETGSDSNIKASKFSVPKLTGTPYYYSIWAESTSQMTGGSEKDVKKITKDDIENAKNTLTKKLLDQAEKELKDKLGEDDIILEGALDRTVIETSSDSAADTTGESFKETAKVAATAIVFKKTDLDSFVKKYIASKLTGDKNVLESSVTTNYTPDLVDVEKGRESMNLTLAFKTYGSIDQNGLASELSKKSSDEIKNVIETKYGEKVSQVTVKLWPFWVTKAPNNTKKIKVELKFE